MNDRMGDPQESANERRHEHVEAVEEILESVDPALEEHAYPVSSEELSARYGSTNVELPNETESLGSVFDRLEDREFDSPMAVKEEVLRAASGASPGPSDAGDGRAPPADHGGTPQEVVDDLETEAVAESTRTPEGPGAGPESENAGPAVDAADGTESDAAEPGDEMTPETTETDEFAPQESLEDRDRESDRGDRPEAGAEERGDATSGPVPDARDEDAEVTREGNLPDDEDGSDGG